MERKKEITCKEGKMKDIIAREGYTVLWGRVRSVGPGCIIQISDGIVTSRDSGVLRDSRSAGPMGVGGCLLLCGGMCALRG